MFWDPDSRIRGFCLPFFRGAPRKSETTFVVLDSVLKMYLEFLGPPRNITLKLLLLHPQQIQRFEEQSSEIQFFFLSVCAMLTSEYWCCAQFFGYFNVSIAQKLKKKNRISELCYPEPTTPDYLVITESRHDVKQVNAESCACQTNE